MACAAWHGIKLASSLPFTLRRTTKVDTVLRLIKLAATSPIVLTTGLCGASGLRAAHGLWTIRGATSGDASRITSLSPGRDTASRAVRGSATI